MWRPEGAGETVAERFPKIAQSHLAIERCIPFGFTSFNYINAINVTPYA